MNIKNYKRHTKRGLFLVGLFSMSLLGGCLDASTSSDDDLDKIADMVVPESGINFDIATVNYAGITVDETDLVVGSRMLAAQCAQCHGSYGVAVRDWPNLWGSSSVSRVVLDYQDEALYGESSMHLHALAYTEEEVNLLKAYYSKVTYDAAAEQGE